MEVPADAPATCPVCDRPYDSVSRHDDGLLVNLLDNDHYRRVCFQPVTVDGAGRVDFYHHTHTQCEGTLDEAGAAGRPGVTDGGDGAGDDGADGTVVEAPREDG